ncbi:hypothetical protein SAMN04488523_103317 [Sulfitobacter brevis]|uniref:Porin n=1 Tax=Sulfitobacter brevis TaxID=74348 RepID=A0A1I1W6Y6_9RHOB|nr:hypothetical protein [Sulfitobacter brevis]SFD90884.1 hypothetical protein SAMN04488523_103317 [Sulfitobacter brevis]
MNTTVLLAGSLGLSGLIASGATAQQTGFTWDGSFEIGIDSTLHADDPTTELTDTYGALDLGFEVALGARATIFGALTLESVSDAAKTRHFDDLGFYTSELGLRLAFGDTTVSFGKISPVFGVAWDDAPGFYGSSLAGDYELSEMIGAMVETPLAGGVLSFASFYADDTFLSDSVGNKRGRNSVAAGGIANTGKHDNFALQWAGTAGMTEYWAGVRHLSAGVGDVSDENGVVAGLAQDFGNGFDGLVELAHFNGAAGTSANATYVTVGGTNTVDRWAFSATSTAIDLSDGGADTMIALGADYTFANDVELNLGLARFDVGGDASTAVGIAAVIPLG